MIPDDCLLLFGGRESGKDRNSYSSSLLETVIFTGGRKSG